MLHESALSQHPTPQTEAEPDESFVTARLPRQRRQRRRRRLVRGLLLVAVMSAPLLIGGGPLWAQLSSVFMILCAAAVCVFTRAYSIRLPAFFAVAVVCVVATAIQVVPLPAWLVSTISPQALVLRMDVQGQPLRWLPLTLDVPATLIELAKAFAYLVLFVVTVGVARRPRGAKGLLLGLAFMGGGCAASALLHRFVGLESFFGLYRPREHPGLGFFAPFVNGNQAAALMTLSSLVALGLAVQTAGLLRWLCIGSLTLACIVVPMTGARAAFVSLALAATVLLVRLFLRRFGGWKAALISTCLVVTAAALTLLATDILRSRFEGGVSALLQNQKTRGWRDSIAMIAQFPWAGVGRGAFEGPIARYRQASEGVRLGFPEALPLQLASEWGLPLACLIALLSLVAVSRLLRTRGKLEPGVFAAAIAVAGVFMQELASFSLELTGIAIPTIVALAVVVGRVQQAVPGGHRLPRLVTGPTLGLAALAFAFALWAYPRSAAAEGERMRQMVSRGHKAGAAIAGAMVRHPADAYLALLAHLDAVTHEPARAEAALDHALRLAPTDGTLTQMSARWLVRRQLLAQAALAYKLAAERGVRTERSELLTALGPALVSEAVPQHQSELIAVARVLLEHKHIEEANIASARAVDVAFDPEDAGMERVALAMQSGSATFMTDAADDLLLRAKSAHAFGLVARAYANAGANSLADAAIAKGLAAHPQSGALVVQGARLRLGRGDSAAALAWLKLQAVEALDLSEQIELAQLRAELLEAQGDRAGAVTARARARLMTGRLGQGAE